MDEKERMNDMNKKGEMMDSPMDKNGLGDGLSSKNDKRGENPHITMANGAPFIITKTQ